jgi:hypothetical protein
MLYFRFIASTLILLSLCACERETYTTWSCNTPNTAKTAMVLKKAQMELNGARLDYCGSLGNQSYFAPKCPAQIEQSSTRFTPSSGALVNDGQEYQCTAL